MDQQIPVRVAIRCRPLIKKERNEGCEASVQADPESKTIQMRGDSRVYTFDWTFAPSAPQFEIYEACVQGRLDSVFKGYNLTVLAYGQTGSGRKIFPLFFVLTSLCKLYVRLIIFFSFEEKHTPWGLNHQ